MQFRTAVVLLAAGIPAQAQTQGFVYLGAGGGLPRAFAGDPFVHLGGGAEYVTKRGLGIEADAGVMGLWFSAAGTLSVDGSYHFRHQRSVDPFVTAGYSL